MYNSNSLTFWKRQNSGDGRKISGCCGAGWGRWTGRAERIFRAVNYSIESYFVRWFIHSFIHSFIPSFLHCFGQQVFGGAPQWALCCALACSISLSREAGTLKYLFCSPRLWPHGREQMWSVWIQTRLHNDLPPYPWPIGSFENMAKSP